MIFFTKKNVFTVLANFFNVIYFQNVESLVWKYR